MNTKGCKFVLGIILSHLLWISASAQVSFGHPEKINRQWKFTLSDPQEAKQLEYEDAHWQTVDLPHDWSIEGRMSPHLASATGYLPGGIGWYRKVVRIPADKRQEKVFLYFEGIYNRSADSRWYIGSGIYRNLWLKRSCGRGAWSKIFEK